MRSYVARLLLASLLPLAAASACRRTAEPVDVGVASPSASTSLTSKPAEKPAGSFPAPPGTGLTEQAPRATSPTPPDDGKHCLSGPQRSGDGESSGPTKSHDGQATVWTESESGNAWLCFERSGKRKVLLRTNQRTPDGGVEEAFSDFADFVWSRDDRNVFFTAPVWAVSRGAFGVEVATGNHFFITDGTILEELDKGPYRGSLHASHFRLDEEHKVGDPGYTGRGVVTDIIDWHGRRLAKVPDEGGDLKERKRVLGR